MPHLTGTTLHVSTAGTHTLKFWIVDPGVVVDALMLGREGASDAGYSCPTKSAPCDRQTVFFVGQRGCCARFEARASALAHGKSSNKHGISRHGPYLSLFFPLRLLF